LTRKFGRIVLVLVGAVGAIAWREGVISPAAASLADGVCSIESDKRAIGFVDTGSLAYDENYSKDQEN
jgi:hypothetical protein